MNDKYTDQSDIISEKKMIDIIYDMALINVSKGINKRILENNGMKPQSYILKKYKIDSLLFVRSNNFYAKDLDKYLYSAIINTLWIPLPHSLRSKKFPFSFTFITTRLKCGLN